MTGKTKTPVAGCAFTVIGLAAFTWAAFTFGPHTPTKDELLTAGKDLLVAVLIVAAGVWIPALLVLAWPEKEQHYQHNAPKPRGAYVKRPDYSPRFEAHKYDIRLGEPVKQGRGADVMIEDYQTFDEMLADNEKS